MIEVVIDSDYLVEKIANISALVNNMEKNWHISGIQEDMDKCYGIAQMAKKYRNRIYRTRAKYLMAHEFYKMDGSKSKLEDLKEHERLISADILMVEYLNYKWLEVLGEI